MVTAIMIVEIMGRPPEHLKSSLEGHIAKLDSVKGVNVIKKDFSEPKEITEEGGDKENKGLFTCFSEIEFECESFSQLANIMFDFMPASVEIVDPATVVLTSDEATSFMNNLTGRLHRYDDIVKIVNNREIQMQRQFVVAQKLLYGHGIIDKDGKILKIPKENKEEGDGSEEGERMEGNVGGREGGRKEEKNGGMKGKRDKWKKKE